MGSARSACGYLRGTWAALLLVVLAAASATATASPSPTLAPLPLLLLSTRQDVAVTPTPYGRFFPAAVPAVPYAPPPSAPPLLQLPPGSRLLAAFAPTESTATTTHIELFYTIRSELYAALATTDLRALLPSPAPRVVARIPDSDPKLGACTAKTVGRRPANATGAASPPAYTLLLYCSSLRGAEGDEGVRALAASDLFAANATAVFEPASPDPGLAYHDHDDQQVIFSPEDRAFVAAQIFFQNYTTPGYTPTDPAKQTLKYCDNAGCLFRRLISTRTSADGLHWSNSSACSNEAFAARTQMNYCHLPTPSTWNSSGLLAPDAADPPELEFYKLSMFWVGMGSARRLLGHALLYAPAPYQDLGDHYGMMSKGVACTGPGGLGRCHGPHMYLERFVGPGRRPTDLPGWERPFRDTRVAPRDALLSVGPVPFLAQPAPTPNATAAAGTTPATTLAALLGSTTAANSHVFLDTSSSGALELLLVPRFRFSGLYAPANAEMSTLAFAWPASGRLVLNVDAHWEQGPGGDCDEKCQAYAMVAVQDAATGAVLPGYEQHRCVMYNLNSLAHALSWPGAPPISAGTGVRLRLFWRDATLYSIEEG